MSFDLREVVIEAGKLMAVSARTAPKTKGIDDVELKLIYSKEELEELAGEMEKLGEELGMHFFARDAASIRKSHAVLLIGVKASKPKDLDCGACGFESCEEFRRAARRSGKGFAGPSCGAQLIDLGIAIGSAVKTASLLNIDNRVMFSVGAAALRMGLLKNSDIAFGIPLSAYGKNIYFDRKK